MQIQRYKKETSLIKYVSQKHQKQFIKKKQKLFHQKNSIENKKEFLKNREMIQPNLNINHKNQDRKSQNKAIKIQNTSHNTKSTQKDKKEQPKQEQLLKSANRTTTNCSLPSELFHFEYKSKLISQSVSQSANRIINSKDKKRKAQFSLHPISSIVKPTIPTPSPFHNQRKMQSNPQAQSQHFIHHLMRYLSRIQQLMQQVPLVWIAIDSIQFLTISICLLGQVIQSQFHTQTSQLINNFFNLFFNYNTIYEWLVMTGAGFACVIVVGLCVYLVVQRKVVISRKSKHRVLSYCALTSILSIAVCQLFFQVIANNLTNTIKGIFDKSLNMNVSLVIFFLLNLSMMVFVSIFNSERRIFRFCLAFVPLALNLIPFTVTCVLLVGLSVYYERMDRLVYKKLFYFVIMLTCMWCALQINDHQTTYFLGSRFIYFSATCAAILLYFINFQNNPLSDSCIIQNHYLVELYKKKLKKEDKKEDYLLADQYFTMHYERQTQTRLYNGGNVEQSHLLQSVQRWSVGVMKQKLIDKIKWDRRNSTKTLSARGDISYFQLLIQLKVNMVTLLRQVFQLMHQKQHDNIQVTYQINKLINRIKKQFQHETPSTQDQVLKVEAIINLEHLYQKFYRKYATIVEHLQDIFDSIQKHRGQIVESTEGKLANFTKQQKLLKGILMEIQEVAPNKLQTRLYNILSQLWDNYQNNSQTSSLNLQHHTNLPQSAQKFSFSYVVISNQTIKYASVKFLSTFSYKQSYIIGENISMIFPNKFSQFIVELLEKNAEKKIFHSQVPILNQKGIFEVVDSTFYLLPEFKGEITYIILFKNNVELEAKSLFLFNSGTLCIEGFNRKIIRRFKFSLQKISLGLQKGAIQFSNLFIFNNQDIDIFTSPPKHLDQKSKLSRRSTQKKTHLSVKQSDKSIAMKAMLKMDYLGEIKRAGAKNVNLQTEISFDINNISYKVIKVEDASHEKFVEQSTSQQDRTWEIKILGDEGGRGGELEKSTKDLKKRYQHQKFFCPIPNPYLPRILQKLNSFQQPGRLSNLMLIRIFFTLNLLFFLGGMTGIFIESNNFQSSIIQFQQQAKSLNRQYSYFMEGIVHAYAIHHMNAFPEEFVAYIKGKYGMGEEEARVFYKEQVRYLYADKKSIIQAYQDAYFNVPIVYDTPQPINVSIFTDWFILTGSSQTTLYYDIVVFMLDSQSAIIENVITQNFQLFTTLLKILRPDGRYNSKINSLEQIPTLIMLAMVAVMVVICVVVYWLLYQLRDTREEIKAIYQLIRRREIENAKRKVGDIQDMIQVLTNNKKSPSQQISQTQSRPTTISEINSVHNLDPQTKKSKGSIRSFQGDGRQTENESAKLLSSSMIEEEDNDSEDRKGKGKWNIKSTSRGLGIVIETLLRYPLYFILLVIHVGALIYIYFSMDQRNGSYIQAFQYFQKIRGQNFQFRYLYAKSQQYAFFNSVKNTTYTNPNPFNLSYKNTQFSYERPDGFVFSVDENLCSPVNLANMSDPWFANYSCTEVDGRILTQQFSEANQQYQRNLRRITNATYRELITVEGLVDTYFNTIYEYQVFKNYFNQLSEMNFQQNVDHMGAQYQQDVSYLYYAIIVWAVLLLLLGFVFTFPKLLAEIQTIISLIKLIPSQTLLNMKAASLIKKRNLLEKLSRL